MKIKFLSMALLVALVSACGGGGGSGTTPSNAPDNESGTPTGGDTSPASATWVAFLNQDRQLRIASTDGRSNTLISSYPIIFWADIFEYDADVSQKTITRYARVGKIYYAMGRFWRLDLTGTEQPSPVQLSNYQASTDLCRISRIGEYTLFRDAGPNGTCDDADDQWYSITDDMLPDDSPIPGYFDTMARSFETGMVRLLRAGSSGLVSYDANRQNRVVLDASATRVEAVYGVSPKSFLMVDNTLRFFDPDNNTLGPVVQTLSSATLPSITYMDNNGLVYYTHDGNLYKVDPNASTPAIMVGSLPATGNNTFMGILNDKAVFLNRVPAGENQIYVMDVSTGQGTSLVTTNDTLSICAMDDNWIYFMRVPGLDQASISRISLSGDVQNIAAGYCIGINKEIPLRLSDFSKSRYLLTVVYNKDADGNTSATTLRILSLGDTVGTAEFDISAMGFGGMASWDFMGMGDTFLIVGYYREAPSISDLIRISYSSPGKVVQITKTPSEGEFYY